MKINKLPSFFYVNMTEKNKKILENWFNYQKSFEAGSDNSYYVNNWHTQSGMIKPNHFISTKKDKHDKTYIKITDERLEELLNDLLPQFLFNIDIDGKPYYVFSTSKLEAIKRVCDTYGINNPQTIHSITMCDKKAVLSV